MVRSRWSARAAYIIRVSAVGDQRSARASSSRPRRASAPGEPPGSPGLHRLVAYLPNAFGQAAGLGRLARPLPPSKVMKRPRFTGPTLSGSRSGRKAAEALGALPSRKALSGIV